MEQERDQKQTHACRIKSSLTWCQDYTMRKVLSLQQIVLEIWTSTCKTMKLIPLTLYMCGVQNESPQNVFCVCKLF